MSPLVGFSEQSEECAPPLQKPISSLVVIPLQGSDLTGAHEQF
jgi:hypothetical protein